MWQSLLDLIFPPRCEVCKSIGPKTLCEKCLVKIKYLKPTAFFHAVCEYEGVAKKAIKRLKFRKRKNLARSLGALLTNYINHHLWKDSLDMIIPVPLHENRLRDRGFNQAELLALSITQSTNIPTVSGLLFRKKNTHPQFDLPKTQRLKNVRGAFEVRGSKLIKNKNILLIDDIYTTGATAAECTRVLKSAGAASVHILTLSRAV